MKFSFKNIKAGKLKTREFVISIFTLLFVFVAYGVSVREQQKLKLQKIQSEVQKERTDLSSKQSQLMLLTRQPANSKVNDDFEGNRNFSDLIQKLSGGSKAYRVNRLHLEKFEEKNRLSKSSYVLEIESTFVQLSSLIQQLEASPFQVEITKIDVIRMNKDLRQCTAKIFLNSFVERRDL
jgi:hypothetical protein